GRTGDRPLKGKAKSAPWSCNASPSEPRLQCSHRNAWRPRCATARPKRPPPPPACEDHRKAPSPPPPSRGGNHESELKRFGNPSRFSPFGYRSSAAPAITLESNIDLLAQSRNVPF